MVPLVLLKALSDESRLAIFRLLLERDAYSEVISERLKLAPSTVSFHLKKLSDAGLVTSSRDQYYTIYSAVPKLAEMSLKDLVMNSGVKIQEQDKIEEQYKEKVLKSFFKYGKLVKIPSQKMKREWVMERVANSFQHGKNYSQKSAEELLSEIYTEPGLLLKEMLATGALKASEGGVKRPS